MGKNYVHFCEASQLTTFCLMVGVLNFFVSSTLFFTTKNISDSDTIHTRVGELKETELKHASCEVTTLLKKKN